MPGEAGGAPGTGADTPAAASAAGGGRPPVLSVRHLVKRFGPVTAINDVSLDIYPNETLGVVGDNGAGKSTFLSLLSGYYRPDSGDLLYRGRPVRVTSPARTRRDLGIETVYQDLAMAPDLTVWQNLFLGEERRRLRIFLNRREMRAQAARALEKMRAGVGPDRLVGELSGGEQQAVAVARGLLFDRDIVLLDEPTAAVSAAKAEDVLATIRGLHEHGKTVILVSHRLEDVLKVCDRIAVFVTGRLVQVVANHRLSVTDLVHMMFADRVKNGATDGGDGSATAGDAR